MAAVATRSRLPRESQPRRRAFRKVLEEDAPSRRPSCGTALDVDMAARDELDAMPSEDEHGDGIQMVSTPPHAGERYTSQSSAQQ